ncbi:MAG: zinc metallopeptidase [Eubacteriales bacterium]|jgi:Zn-dependent membrane protease YugP
MFYGIDSTYIVLVVPALLLAMWAQATVKSTFARYSQVFAHRGYTGADVARLVLDHNGLQNVRIEHVQGSMTDHYDPRTNVVRLSDTVYGSTSVAAIGVATHEVGHAIQHAEGYFPIKVRTAIIPLTNFGSQLAMPLILFGLLFNNSWLAQVGILFFSFAVLFQLVTLPVEFNASGRALRILDSTGILNEEEHRGARKVLRAAAMTYVAATVVALAQLLRLIILFGGRRNRE